MFVVILQQLLAAHTSTLRKSWKGDEFFRWFPYFPRIQNAVSHRIWFVHYAHLVLTKQFMIKLRLRLEWSSTHECTAVDGWRVERTLFFIGFLVSRESFPPSHSWGFQNWPTEWTQNVKSRVVHSWVWGSTGLNSVAWIFLTSLDFISLQIPYWSLA
jgi:hypothetical protein